ncbi:MAG: tetratricopeptide repeat protein [Bacteroidetes bacterium]|nr:tetratricopeptide repeat protein [Bacteroidota bacterium]
MSKKTLNSEIRNEIKTLIETAYQLRVSDLKGSIILGKKALKKSQEIGDEILIAKSFNHLSLFYMIMGEYTKSLLYSRKAITLFEKNNDENGIADVKYNVASIYYKTDNYHLGLVNLIDCLSIYKKHYQYHSQAKTYKSLGTIYEYFGDQKNAIKSYRSCIKVSKKVGDLNSESNAYNPLSGIYLKQKKYDEALALIEKSIEYKKLTGDLRGLAFAIYGRGKVYTKLEKFELAEKDYLDAMKIHTQMQEKLGMGMAYNKLGALYENWNKTQQAIEILEKGLAYSETYNIAIIKFKCEYTLYKIYKSQNNHLKSLEFLEKYLKDKESVINTQSLKIIENYELITKMKSLEQEKKMRREKMLIVKKKNKAEESAKIKQQFLSNMSHEIRTPLNAVITITDLLKDVTAPQNKDLTDSLKHSANHLLSIVNDILDFTKLDSDKTVLNPTSTNLLLLTKQIIDTYAFQAKHKNLSLKFQIIGQLNPYYMIDELKITQIISNLLTNSIKYTERGGIEFIIVRN